MISWLEVEQQLDGIVDVCHLYPNFGGDKHFCSRDDYQSGERNFKLPKDRKFYLDEFKNHVIENPYLNFNRDGTALNSITIECGHCGQGNDAEENDSEEQSC